MAMSNFNLGSLRRKFETSVNKIIPNLRDNLEQGATGRFVDHMLADGLITKDQKGNFDKMIGYFNSAMAVKETLEHLEAHCCDFLYVLERVNDVCDGCASRLESFWIQDAQSLSIPLTKIGKRHTNPHQEESGGNDYDSYTDVLRAQQGRKYSKKKRAKAAKAKQREQNKAIKSATHLQPARHPKDQVMPHAEDDYYSEAQEPTASGSGSSSSKQWMTARLQENTRTPIKDLPDGSKEVCTLITELYRHDGYTSLSQNYFISDDLDIHGDPIISQAGLNLLHDARQYNTRPKTLQQSRANSTLPTSTQELRSREMSPASPQQPRGSESSSVSPPVTSTTQEIHSPTTSDLSTNKDAHVSPARGGSGGVTDQKTRRSSSLPNIRNFDAQPVQSDSFNNTQGDFKNSEIILPRTSTAAVTATSDCEQIMGKLTEISDCLLRLETTNDAPSQAKCCCSEKVAVLEACLKEKEIQLNDKDTIIDKLMDLLKSHRS